MHSDPSAPRSNTGWGIPDPPQPPAQGQAGKIPPAAHQTVFISIPPAAPPQTLVFAAHLVSPPCRRQAGCLVWSSSSGGCGTGTGTPRWPAGPPVAPSPSPPGSSCTSAPAAGSDPSASRRSPPRRCSPLKTAWPGTCHNTSMTG